MRSLFFTTFKWMFRICLIFLIFYIGIGWIKQTERAFPWKRKRGGITTPIRAIIQTGPQKEALKTAYLAELLKLSIDIPTMAKHFSIKEAERNLLSSGVIKECCVKMKEPGILYIDYSIRQPVALLYEYPNVAIDEEGVPFPLYPFFSPKKLPELYLNLEEPPKWNLPIKGEKMALALKILSFLNGPIFKDLFKVVCIDVSNSFRPSYGRQEVVLSTHDDIVISEGVVSSQKHYTIPRLLRLSTKKYSQELNNYLKLHPQLVLKEKTEIEERIKANDSLIEKVYKGTAIDFRISQLAFIEEIE